MGKNDINAFLGAGTSYNGRLHFQGSVRIDGELQGEVESEGTLVIGREAKLTGQFRVAELVLSGELEGEVEASRKVVLHKQANLVGTVRTPSLVVEEGAVLEGEVIMGTLNNLQTEQHEGEEIKDYEEEEEILPREVVSSEEEKHSDEHSVTEHFKEIFEK